MIEFDDNRKDDPKYLLEYIVICKKEIDNLKSYYVVLEDEITDIRSMCKEVKDRLADLIKTIN